EIGENPLLKYFGVYIDGKEKFLDAGSRFILARAFHRLIAAMKQIAHCNFRKSDEIRLRIEFGEKEVAIFAEKRRH
ncbi:MAG: hypothetical protein ACPLF9_08485, partial [Methanothermobacter tenebrarum]